MSEKRKIDIRVVDAQIAFWQEGANDPSFRDDVFIGALKLLGRRGWSIGPDAEIVKHHNCLKRYHRSGVKAEMEMRIQISGRVVEIELWANNYDGGNPNGNRYGFGKLQKMPYLTRLRIEAEHRALIFWAAEAFLVSVSRPNPMPPAIPAAEYIARRYAESWHSDKTLGRPIASASNSKSGDGGLIEHGARVWFVGHDGRVRRGTAYTNINSMWWVVTAKDAVENLSSYQLLLAPPAQLRGRQHERKRRQRLEDELARATRLMDFRRAELLRRILFGDEQPLLIWSKKNDAYYRPNYSGYTTDLIYAGKYRREEAMKEVARVSHLLVAKMLDGRVVTAS